MAVTEIVCSASGIEVAPLACELTVFKMPVLLTVTVAVPTICSAASSCTMSASGPTSLPMVSEPEIANAPGALFSSRVPSATVVRPVYRLAELPANLNRPVPTLVSALPGDCAAAAVVPKIWPSISSVLPSATPR